MCVQVLRAATATWGSAGLLLAGAVLSSNTSAIVSDPAIAGESASWDDCQRGTEHFSESFCPGTKISRGQFRDFGTNDIDGIVGVVALPPYNPPF